MLAEGHKERWALALQSNALVYGNWYAQHQSNAGWHCEETFDYIPQKWSINPEKVVYQDGIEVVNSNRVGGRSLIDLWLAINLITTNLIIRITQTSRWPSWSKAPVSGTGPKGHGFESHSWHHKFLSLLSLNIIISGLSVFFWFFLLEHASIVSFIQKYPKPAMPILEENWGWPGALFCSSDD